MKRRARGPHEGDKLACCVDHGRHHRTTFVGAGPEGGADGGMSGLRTDGSVAKIGGSQR